MDTKILNGMWQQLVPTLKQEHIIADRVFYSDAADRFTITVVVDETDKKEQPFETVLEAGFASALGVTVDDLVGLFLHVASHQRCDLFWQRCPVPMEQFSAIQLDLIEEIYNQRLVSIIAPSFYNTFPRINAIYDVYKGFNVAKRAPLQTMFTMICNTNNVQLDVLHKMLYSSNPLDQTTFNTYMHVWSLLLKNQQIVDMIEQYESGD